MRSIKIITILIFNILLSQNNTGAVNNDWHTNGNIIKTGDFLGTKNNFSLCFKANNDLKMTLWQNDSIQFKIKNKPFLRLDTNGYLTNANTGTTNGYFWGLKGNSGTNANVNFLGTTDQNDIVIKYNNQEIARFSNQSLNYRTRIFKIGNITSTSDATFVVRSNNYFKIMSLGTSDTQTFEVLKSYSNSTSLSTNSSAFLTGYNNARVVIGSPDYVSSSQLIPSTTLVVNSRVTNDSGLQLYFLTNTSPSTSNAKPIGVDSSGKVVTIDSSLIINNSAINATTLQTSMGNIEFPNAGNGVILKSPNGTKYLITINDNGTLNSQKIN